MWQTLRKEEVLRKLSTDEKARINRKRSKRKTSKIWKK